MASHAKRGEVIGWIIEWNRNWILMGGFVACTECLMYQSIECMGEPFKHSEHCSKSRESSETPWISLEAILNSTGRDGEEGHISSVRLPFERS